MDNNVKKDNQGFRFTLGIKITVMFSVIIIIMLIPLLLLLLYSNSYINRYDRVLSSIKKLDYIETTTAAQPQRILNYCIINKNIADSGEGEKIETMMQYISDIKYEIGDDDAYADNLAQAVVVENLLNNYLQNYREGIGLCGNNFSLAGDMQFYTMNDISGYLTTNISNLLDLEMQRSADIQDKIAKDYTGMRVKVVILLIVAVLVAIALIIILQSVIAKPVRLMSRKLAVIADKDLTNAEVAVTSNDEVGDLAAAFNVMSDNLKDILEKASQVSNNIEESFQEVTENIEETANGSEHIAGTVVDMMDKLEYQNEESRTAMSNIENISEISHQINSNAESILASAKQSIDGANQGTRKLEDYTTQLSTVNSVMQGITQMVDELGSSTQQMNDIVNTITEISDETNLLSLNASIEAARAGEAGRGFAVVAEQIQKLADSSKQSAEEIGDIIAEVQNRALNMTDEMKQGLLQLEKGNTIAEETKSSFVEIEHSINDVDSLIQEIVNNVRRLFDVVSGTSQNMQAIESVMNDNSKVTKEISDTVNTETANLQNLTATMNVLLENTVGLKETLAQFKL